MNRRSLVSRLLSSDRGQSLVLVPAVLGALLASSALVIDMGNLYLSYQQLEDATQAAAAAGGAAMPLETGAGATAQADLYSGQTSSDYNYHSSLNITNVSVSFACASPTTYPTLKLPPCATSPNTVHPYPGCAITTSNEAGGCNAIQVTETAKVTTFFAKVFGVTTLIISTTASASAAGGGAIPYHIMLVLDTTNSMGQGTDTGCTSSGTGSYSPEQCAQLGVQSFLTELAPCATNLSSCGSSAAVDQVGLMVFPGTCSQTLSGGNCPNATTLSNTTVSQYASDDTSCPATDPPITQYNNDPEYLVIPFVNNYRTSDTAGLNWSSALVDSVGAGTDNCGMPTPGGVETFYAGAVVAAQQYLTANHTSNVQDVMIVLSDGDANSSHMGGTVPQTVDSSDIASMNGKLFSATQQCQQAVQAANWARSVKQSDGTSTEIYSVSYGSELTGCDTDTNPTTTPCLTMEGIASSPSSKYFFSVPSSTAQNGTICNNAVPITQLSQVFTAIGGDLMASRLIPNSVF